MQSNYWTITDTDSVLHDVIEQYLAEFSPVSPKVEDRAIATDTDVSMLTQALGVKYEYR